MQERLTYAVRISDTPILLDTPYLRDKLPAGRFATHLLRTFVLHWAQRGPWMPSTTGKRPCEAHIIKPGHFKQQRGLLKRLLLVFTFQLA